MGTLSTHVLDTSTGRPAAGIEARLETADGTPLAVGTKHTRGRDERANDSRKRSSAGLPGSIVKPPPPMATMQTPS